MKTETIIQVLESEIRLAQDYSRDTVHELKPYFDGKVWAYTHVLELLKQRRTNEG
jgi:hypothetical protein